MARPSSNLGDNGFLQAALEGLLLQKQRIEAQIAEVRSLLGRHRVSNSKAASASGGTKLATARGRRPLSEAARKRIAAAQKKRWAEYRKQHRTAE